MLLAGLATLGCVLVAGPAEARPGAAGKDGRPNILVVMTDDMNQADLAFMPKTRRLLAKQGTTFTNAITSFPLCCPSRATFLTGQYEHNHGVGGNFYPEGWYGIPGRNNTLATWLGAGGYRTDLIGKMLNGYGAIDGHGEIPPGFDQWHGLLDVSAYDYYNFEMNDNGRLRTWGDPDFARKLVEFANIEVDPAGHQEPVRHPRKADGGDGAGALHLLGRQRSEPVLARCHRPHHEQAARSREEKKEAVLHLVEARRPASRGRLDHLDGTPRSRSTARPRYEQLSKSFQLPRPPSFNEADVSDKATDVTKHTPPLTNAQINQLQLDYEGRGGSLRAVDDKVGRMVKTLHHSGQLADTVIVFTSDNGWMQGEHRIPGDKFLPYEESLGVPLIFRGPGIARGRRINRQVANIDIAPTLAALARVKARRQMDGISLVPTLRGRRKPPKRALAVEAPRPLFEGAIPQNTWDRPYMGVRTQRYTYVVYTETSEEELYDRRADPYELTNVAQNPAYAGVRAHLSALTQRLHVCRGRGCLVKP